ncbi:MAG: DUF6263 family protein [Bacteroidota bacterium]
MKLKIFSFFITTLITLFLISCGSDDKKESAASQAYDNLPSVDMKGEKVKLRYKFENGDKFKYRLTTITDADEIIQADSTIKSKSNQNVIYVFDIEVIEVDADKIAEVSINISSVKVNVDVNGQKYSYNTNSENSVEEKRKFLEYETIYNTPFRARVNNKGEVIEVSRLDKMIDKMNSMQPQKQTLSADQKAQLSKNLGDVALRPLTQLLFRELPDNSLAKDSNWVKRYPGQMSVFKLDNTAKFTVLDFVDLDGDKGAKIKADLSVTWTGDKQGEENGVKYTFDEPKASGGGVIVFNVDKGNLVNAETSTRLEMSVQIQAKDSMQKIQRTTRREISTNKNIVELL